MFQRNSAVPVNSMLPQANESPVPAAMSASETITNRASAPVVPRPAASASKNA
jgi:hypothetical protein